MRRVVVARASDFVGRCRPRCAVVELELRRRVSPWAVGTRRMKRVCFVASASAIGPTWTCTVETPVASCVSTCTVPRAGRAASVCRVRAAFSRLMLCHARGLRSSFLGFVAQCEEHTMIRGTYILANIGVRLQGTMHPHRRVTHTVHGTRVRLDPTYNIAASTGTSTFIQKSRGDAVRERMYPSYLAVCLRAEAGSPWRRVCTPALCTLNARGAMRRPRINQ